jgi:hypothetical protein
MKRAGTRRQEKQERAYTPVETRSLGVVRCPKAYCFESYCPESFCQENFCPLKYESVMKPE